MFAKKYRLPPAPLHNPSTIHSSFFILKVSKNALEYNRYGFIVSKKVDKRATVRNRIKRKLRACVEKMHSSLHTGNDMLFIIKKEAVAQPANVLCVVVEGVFKKSILI